MKGGIREHTKKTKKSVFQQIYQESPNFATTSGGGGATTPKSRYDHAV